MILSEGYVDTINFIYYLIYLIIKISISSRQRCSGPANSWTGPDRTVIELFWTVRTGPDRTLKTLDRSGPISFLSVH